MHCLIQVIHVVKLVNFAESNEIPISLSHFSVKMPFSAQTNEGTRPRSQLPMPTALASQQQPQQPGQLFPNQLLGPSTAVTPGYSSHYAGYGHALGLEPGHLLLEGERQREVLEGERQRPPELSWQNWQFQLHNSGQCYPCIAFALKPAGCFKGDACRHCHFCNAQQAKARRRQLQQAARRQKRRQGMDVVRCCLRCCHVSA